MIKREPTGATGMNVDSFEHSASAGAKKQINKNHTHTHIYACRGQHPALCGGSSSRVRVI